MPAPFALARRHPELARLRDLRDWDGLGRIWPTADVGAAVEGWVQDLGGWGAIEIAVGDPHSAGVHADLMATVREAAATSPIRAYDRRVSAAREPLPAPAQAGMAPVDGAYRRHLLGGTTDLKDAEQAWIAMVASGAVDALDPGPAMALLCDGVALHAAIYDRDGDPDSLGHLAGLLAAVLSRWRDGDGPLPGSTAIHLDPRLVRMTGELALANRRLFDATGDQGRLARAARLAEGAVTLCVPGAPDRGPWVVEAALTSAWAVRVLDPNDSTAAALDLPDAADRLRSAALDDPPGTRTRGRALDLLAQFRWDEYRSSHDRSTLREAVAALRLVLAEGGPRPPGCEQRYAVALLARFLETGGRATGALTDVVAALDDGAAVAGRADSGSSLATRLLEVLRPRLVDPDSTDLVDLGVEALSRLGPDPGAALQAAESALRLRRQGRPEGHAGGHGAEQRSHGGSGWRDRDVRIDLLRAATMLDPSVAAYASDLAAELGRRFEETGAFEDLDRAIEHLQRTVAEQEDRAGAGAVLNLALLLGRRADLLGSDDDRTRAGEHARRAVELAEQEGDLRTLGLALGVRAADAHDAATRSTDPRERQTQTDDAIADWRHILRLDLPEQHPMAAYNLGNALLAAAEASPEATPSDDGSEVFTLLHRAVDGLDSPSADAAFAANRLAEAYRRWGRPPDPEQEVTRWGEQAISWARPSSPEALLRVAWDHAVRAEGRQDWEAAAGGYLEVIDAMQRLVRATGRAEGKDAWLAHGFGAPTRACCALIRCGRAAEAAAALEKGRTLLLLDALGVDGSGVEGEVEVEGGGEVAAGAGDLAHPMLYLVPGVTGGYALLLDPTFLDPARGIPGGELEPQVIALDRLSEAEVGAQTRAFRRGMLRAGDNPRGWTRVLDRVCRWLGEVCEPAFAALPPGRVTLVPAGALAVLPVHAAQRGDGRTLAETHVVHYSPSRQVSSVASRRRAIPGGGLLVAADPDQSVEPRLANARLEGGVAAAYAMEVLGPEVPRRVLAGAEATVADVLASLPTTRVLHLACHGRADLHDPRRSGLLMAGGEVLTLPMLGYADMRHARLAFLSACESGVPGAGAPDEVLSLGSAVFAAGVDAVVSSLWPVSDFSTLVLTALFYAALRATPDDPASALAAAQAQMRSGTDHDVLDLVRTLVGAGQVDAEAGAEIVRVLAERPAGSRRLAQPDAWAGFVLTGQ